ncbi:pilin [Streptomyces sioyaensis]|uniref:pilin n=1 Tax=Streptomyces sioyaensis TaxID=67364 RepID=UPI003EBAB6F4
MIKNLRNWVVGILSGLATLFLTFGGLRYLMAGGDPGEVESAKRALKAAAIGYGLAVLAPASVTVLQHIVGVGGGGGK